MEQTVSSSVRSHEDFPSTQDVLTRRCSRNWNVFEVNQESGASIARQSCLLVLWKDGVNFNIPRAWFNSGILWKVGTQMNRILLHFLEVSVVLPAVTSASNNGPNRYSAKNNIFPAFDLLYSRTSRFNLHVCMVFAQKGPLLVGEALHMPWVPLYRSSIGVVDGNALQQQRQSFLGNAFLGSSACCSMATLSSSS
jgi:hypothetical protein